MINFCSWAIDTLVTKISNAIKEFMKLIVAYLMAYSLQRLIFAAVF
jgi:hypothetical protein